MVFYPQQKFVSLGMTNGEVRVWDGVRRLLYNNSNNSISSGGGNKNSINNNNSITNYNKETQQQYYQLISHYGPVQRMKLRFYL